MLLKLRGGLDSFLVTILLGLLIGSFAIFGIGSSAFTSNNQQVASVGDTPISTQTYYSRVQSRAQSLQQQYGAQFTVPQLINMMQLDQLVLQQMVTEAAVKEHLSSLGMRAGNAELRSELESSEELVLPDGTLSREMVLQVLSNTGVTRAEFLDQVRTNISRRQMVDSFIVEGLMPREYAESLYKYQSERRRATMIDIKTNAVGDLPVADEEQLRSYFDLNKAVYQTDERRSYNYVLVTLEQFMDDIEVPEDSILAEYEDKRDSYVTPEERGLQQVNFADKAAADAFLVAVGAGADFVEAGASVTDFTAEEIELGDFAQSELVEDYGEEASAAIFALTEGGVSAPFEGFGGWNVFRVASITAAEERSLEDVRDEITRSLKQDQAEELMYEKVGVVSEAMSETGDLGAIAKAAGLTLATVTNVNARGLSVDGTASATQANEFTILRDAFSRDLGTEADMVDLDPRDNAKGFYMVEITDHKEPTQKQFEDIREEIKTAWLAEKRLEKAAELAEEAKTRLAAGEDAEAVALALNGTSFDAKNVARTADANSSLSGNIRRLIFDLNKDEIDFERASDGNGYVVIRVDEITPGAPKERPAEVDTLLTSLNGQMLEDVFTQYQAYLLKAYDIQVNTTLQQSLFADGALQ